MASHLSACREVTQREALAEYGIDAEAFCLDAGIEDHRLDEMRLVVCADGCPVLEETRERVEKLVKEYGW